MRKIKNRDEIIYLLCFNTPQNKTRIAKIIYEKPSRALVDVIKILVKDKKVEQFSPSELSDGLKERMGLKKNQKIHGNNRFIYARPEPLYDSIIADLDGKEVILYEFDKKQTSKLIDSDEFRYFAQNNIMKFINNDKTVIQKYPPNFKLIKNALGLHCTRTLEYRERRKEKNSDNQEEMEKYLINPLKQDNAIPDIVKHTREFDDKLLKKLSRLDYARHAAIEGWYAGWYPNDNNP